MEKKFDYVLKDGIAEYLYEKGIKDFNNATPQQRGKALTEFYIKEIDDTIFADFPDL